MKIDKDKMHLMQARRGLKLSELGIAKGTLQRINEGLDLRPCTVSKVAQALDVDPLIILFDPREHEEVK